MSENVIELYVIDFVGSLSLESLVNEGVLDFARLHFKVVEDRSESAHLDKSTL